MSSKLCSFNLIYLQLFFKRWFCPTISTLYFRFFVFFFTIFITLYFIFSNNLLEASCLSLSVEDKIEFINDCLSIINAIVYKPRHLPHFSLTELQIKSIVDNCTTYDAIVREIFIIVDSEMSSWQRFEIPSSGTDLCDNYYIFIFSQCVLTFLFFLIFTHAVDICLLRIKN